MEALNESSKLVAQAIVLINGYMEHDFLDMQPLIEAKALLENTLNKLVEKM